MFLFGPNDGATDLIIIILQTFLFYFNFNEINLSQGPTRRDILTNLIKQIIYDLKTILQITFFFNCDITADT